MKKYLLVSAMPTPNGGLHLGHLAAQFLPEDIFKRYQQQRGHQVAFCGGFDVYDNAICVAADKYGLSPYEMAMHFQKIISDELRYFGIRIDTLINYLDPDMVERARRAESRVRERIQPYIRAQTGAWPYSRQGKPVTGNWLSGRCKGCHSLTKGYSCDACGISVTPDDLYDLQFGNGEGVNEILWQEKTVEFVQVPGLNLLNYINQQEISDDLKSFCRALNRSERHAYQWTSIDQWGLALSSKPDDRLFFNRNFTLIEQYILSELYSESYGEDPFSPDSEVCTILAYGKDNIGLLLVDLPRIALGTGLIAPYQHHWVSHFYCLADRKMSTSKNLAIWLSELISEGISSDSVRAYLCSKYARDKDTDLSLVALRQEEKFCHELRQAISEADRRTSQDGTHVILAQKMYDTGKQAALLFSQPRPDLVRYYALYREFCSLIYSLNGAEITALWKTLFREHFSALVPDIAASISEAGEE